MRLLRAYAELGLCLLLLAILFTIDQFLGRRVLFLAAGFSALWFVIAFVLLTRPPGIPEFVSERPGSDEQYVVRRDVLPPVPPLARFRLSLTVACGSCLLILLTLTLLAR